jgi:hypothetical protein
VRGIARSAALLLLGVFFGAVATAGAAGQAFSPAPWFWPATWTCLTLGLICLGSWAWLGGKEAAFHNSEAVDLVFEGPSTPCLYEFDGFSGMVPIGTTYLRVPNGDGDQLVVSPGLVMTGRPSRQAMLRLRAKNLRGRRLSRVTVRLVEATLESNRERAYPYSDFLKWMHDDSPSHPLSIEGRELNPSDDPAAYLDLATKEVGDDEYVLELAMPHLRNVPLRAVSTLLHLVVQATDEDTGRRAPDSHRAFQIDIKPDGRMTLTPRALEECGFAKEG